jgi:hypothetical protein
MDYTAVGQERGQHKPPSSAVAPSAAPVPVT